MPTRFTEIHISSPVPSMSLRAKDHLEGTKVVVFPSLCAPQERPVRQRSGLAVTEEWRPGRRRATWLPEEEQATQREATSPTTRDCVCRVLALQDIASCSQFRSRSSSEMQSAVDVQETTSPEVGEIETILLAFGLCRSVRSPGRFMVFSRPRGLWACSVG